jgi:hypothetical protein
MHVQYITMLGLPGRSAPNAQIARAMFLAGLSRDLKPAVRIQGWRDNKARSLPEAARVTKPCI